MSERVRMTSKSVFQNERITLFRSGGPDEGVKGEPVTMGDEFETDLDHAKELDRLGLAAPKDRADLEGEGAPLEPHYTVSVPDLQRDQAARAAAASPTAEVGAARVVEQTTSVDPAAETPDPNAADDTGSKLTEDEDTATVSSSSRRNRANRAS